MSEYRPTARTLRKYNLTLALWLILWDACKGHCPGCEKPFSSSRLPCVDHDHCTGLVRGLLCTDCNAEAGRRHDDAAWFRRMADYLDYPPTLREAIVVYVPGSIGAERDSHDPVLPG